MPAFYFFFAQMTRLEVLYGDRDWCQSEDRASGLLSVVLRNIATLRELHMDLSLPVPDDGGKYTKLETLRCDVLSDEARASCPVLKDVTERGADDWGEGSISGGEEDDSDWLADNGLYDDWYEAEDYGEVDEDDFGDFDHDPDEFFG